jgi:hypothetical protein
MKTVVNELTGEVKYCFFNETALAENEIIVDAIATGDFYDFEIQDFF